LPTNFTAFLPIGVKFIDPRWGLIIYRCAYSGAWYGIIFHLNSIERNERIVIKVG
jgi:hypothetical protein